MKKHARILFLAACCLPALTGCGKNKTTVNVFAAASMTETLQELEARYEKKNKNIDIVLNLESSGTLQKQIENGADCDIFISAGQKQMNNLEKEGVDKVNKDSRFNILENKVVLATSEANPKNVTGFNDVKTRLLSDSEEDKKFIFGMGNEDVPVGQYTQKILTYLGLNEADLYIAKKISYGTNVKVVTSMIAYDGVACGVVYQTDAFSAKLKVIETATKEMCGEIIYPAALMKNAKQPEQAQAFLDYLKTDESMQVFESVGFSRISA